MTKRSILIAVIAFATIGPLSANQLTVREFHVQALSRPHGLDAHQPNGLIAAADEFKPRPQLDATAPLQLYPAAGTIGRDIFIPYFVDLDRRSGGELDYRCGDYTFDSHTGHDPYIRSFREQAIGVPVFAPLDATVLEVHDGEPDENTAENPNARSNMVVLSHASGYRTEYLHLKRGSITVRPGDMVTAGTQIAMIGSSGNSAAPHLHWDVRVDGTPVEPFAGPCRPGGSMFERQPETTNAPTLIGVALSGGSFSGYPDAPYDNAPRQSTFALGTRLFGLKVEVANVRAGDRFHLTVTKPNGQPAGVAEGQLTAYTAYLASASWLLETPLFEEGNWTVTLRVNGSRVAEIPFRVVANSSQVVNRAPNTPTVFLEPAGLRAGEVAVCRAETGLLADPDTDVVRYRYQWRVGDNIVRDVTTAARSDALARHHLSANRDVSCTVTLSDGKLSTQPIAAHSRVQVLSRRRAAGR